MSEISDIAVCEAVDQYNRAIDKQIETGAWDRDIPHPYEILSKRFGVDTKEALVACKRAGEEGYIAFGISSNQTGYLTDAGKRLIGKEE